MSTVLVAENVYPDHIDSMMSLCGIHNSMFASLRNLFLVQSKGIPKRRKPSGTPNLEEKPDVSFLDPLKWTPEMPSGQPGYSTKTQFSMQKESGNAKNGTLC